MVSTVILEVMMVAASKFRSTIARAPDHGLQTVILQTVFSLFSARLRGGGDSIQDDSLQDDSMKDDSLQEEWVQFAR